MKKIVRERDPSMHNTKSRETKLVILNLRPWPLFIGHCRITSLMCCFSLNSRYS